MNNNIYNNSHTEFDENEVLHHIQSGNSYSALEGKTTISLPILGRILISSTVLESWCNSAFKTVLKSPSVDEDLIGESNPIAGSGDVNVFHVGPHLGNQVQDELDIVSLARLGVDIPRPE